MPGEKSINVWELSDLATPWAVHVAATLRIAERIAEGLTRVEDLAKASGAEEAALTRVLRHLVSKGVFEETAPGSFALNDAARGLMDPGAHLGLDLDGFGGRMARAWQSLLTSVRTGRPAYADVFGRSFWDDLSAHPEIEEQFDALMGPGHGDPDPAVLIDDDWTGVRTVVDVGGGTGSLLAAILAAHPELHGTLVDRPATVARATDSLRQAPLGRRVRLAGQSFFDPLPSGADLYLLKNVLPDWPDEDARVILRRCADAARPDGRIVIVSGISPDNAGGPPPELLMLVLVGGKGRNLVEFRTLAQSAGLRVEKSGPSGRWAFVVECRPDRSA